MRMKICSEARASNSLLVCLEWDLIENVGSLTPLLFSLINRSQMLSEGDQFFHEVEQKRRLELEYVMHDVRRNFVWKLRDPSEKFREQPIEGHIADCIDDYILKWEITEQWTKSISWMDWIVGDKHWVRRAQEINEHNLLASMKIFRNSPRFGSPDSRIFSINTK